MPWDLRQDSRRKGLAGEIFASREDTQLILEKITDPIDSRVNKLALICEAMWQLLKEHTDLNEADLEERIVELDMMDGRLDGKLNRAAAQGPPQICPECGARIPNKFNRCQFCGHKSERVLSPFDALE